jgi:hypothetical protein
MPAPTITSVYPLDCLKTDQWIYITGTDFTPTSGTTTVAISNFPDTYPVATVKVYNNNALGFYLPYGSVTEHQSYSIIVTVPGKGEVESSASVYIRTPGDYSTADPTVTGIKVIPGDINDWFYLFGTNFVGLYDVNKGTSVQGWSTWGAPFLIPPNKVMIYSSTVCGFRYPGNAWEDVFNQVRVYSYPADMDSNTLTFPNPYPY